ncbi:MAG: hypothetical protein U0793_30890 [Gemmataceae bacterium]
MSRILKILAVSALLLVGTRAFAFPEDEEDKKKADAIREKKAFDALITRAEEEYRVFFKKPEEAYQFWAAMKFEIDTGKFDIAALHLKLMLALPPEKSDPDLLKIIDREGLSTFTRLQTVRIWSVHEPFQKEAEKNVQVLLDRVRNALETHLSNPKRINFFIENLAGKTPEEREFAKAELNRSRERAVPYLVEALRAHAGKALGDRVAEYMVIMEEDMVAPLLEIFKVPFPEPGDPKDKDLRDKDAQDANLRLILLNVFKKRGDIRREKGFSDDLRLVPYLWHIAGGAGTKSRLPYNPLVRQKARDMLAYYLRVDPDRLPRAPVVLTDLAERYYQKKERFRGKDRIPLWRWNSVELAQKPLFLTPRQMEQVLALRYAKEALDLDPTYLPAQRVLLSQQMDMLYRPAISSMLGSKGAPPDMDDLLARVDPELLASTLEKAMDERNLPVILGAVRALGRRGDPLAAKAIPAAPPRGIVRAIDYPDRRVQWAALLAIVNMPAPPPVISSRVVELLQRNLAATGQPRAVAIGFPAAAAADLRNALKDAGFLPFLERDFKTGFARIKESSDADLVVVYGGGVATPELPFLVGQIRADVDTGMLPIIVVAPTLRPDVLTKEREAKDLEEGRKAIEKRLSEEKLKKIREFTLKTKDLAEVDEATKAFETVYAKEKVRQLKEFEDAFNLEVAKRRLDASKVFEDRLNRLLAKQTNVWIVPELHVGMPEQFRKEIDAALEGAYVARVTPDERDFFRRLSMGLAWSMSRGELPGYNVRPLEDELLALVRSKATPPDTATLAIEALARMPGAEIQQSLAAVTLNPAKEKLRIPAAFELNRHVKTYGVLLRKEQIKEMRKVQADPAEDPTLRGQLALVLGATGAPPTFTGDRLFDFRPAPPPPPMKKEEKEKKDG